MSVIKGGALFRLLVGVPLNSNVRRLTVLSMNESLKTNNN